MTKMPNFLKQSLHQVMSLRLEQGEIYSKGILFNPTYDFDTLSHHNQTDIKNQLTELATLIPIEIDGGVCPTCKKKWARIEYAEGKRAYHVPMCFCYAVCPVCSSRLYEEQLRGDLTHGQHRDMCPQCGWRLYTRNAESVINGKRWGEYKALDAKMRAKINAHRLEYVRDRFGMEYVEKAKGVFKMVNGIPFDPVVESCPTWVGA